MTGKARYGLTPRQAELVVFIADRIARTGSPPSWGDMMAHLGISSKASLARHLDGLEERGAIRRLNGQSHSITVLDPPDPEAAKARAEAWARRGFRLLGDRRDHP